MWLADLLSRREDIKKKRDLDDPIGILRTRLIDSGFATEDELKVGYLMRQLCILS